MLHVWNIYQHLPQKSPSFVGKYSSTMEHLGMLLGDSSQSTSPPPPKRFPSLPSQPHHAESADLQRSLELGPVSLQLDATPCGWDMRE